MNSRLALVAVVGLGLWYARQGSQVAAVEAPSYAIDDLGSIGGSYTGPTDINDAGDVAGTAQTATNDYHAFLYADSTGIRDLGTLSGSGWSQAFGINNQRHVSGSFTRADGSVGAFLYGDEIGTVVLGTIAGGSMSAARGLNDADRVTGSSWLASGGHAFLWSAGTGMQDLGTLNGPVSNGERINQSGQVVGQAVAIDDPYFPVYHAFRYTEGVGMQDLGTLPGTPRTYSSAKGINADADVVGYSYDPGYAIGRAFLYRDRDGMRDLGTLGGRSSSASNINDNGAVVGIANLPSGQQHPFLHTDAAGMVDLNALIDTTTGWTLWTAEAINNHGTIVGIGTMGGRSRGYRARRIRDDSAPEVVPVVFPPPNAAGWNNTDVTVRWRLRDPESGIASSSGCDPQIVTDGTPGLTLTCTATNPFGGSTTAAVTLRIDKSSPEISASISPTPNATGWNTSDVTVAWSVRDPESGVAFSSGCNTQTLTNETAGVTLTCAAVNNAGGSTSRSVTVKIDKTPPLVSCAPTPSIVWPPNGEMVPVSIAVAVNDTPSGGSAFTLFSISVDDPTAGPNAVTGFRVGSASTTGAVQALRPADSGSRVYSFTYIGSDAAGLTGSCVASVVVPHDSSQ